MCVCDVLISGCVASPEPAVCPGVSLRSVSVASLSEHQVQISCEYDNHIMSPASIWQNAKQGQEYVSTCLCVCVCGCVCVCVGGCGSVCGSVCVGVWVGDREVVGAGAFFCFSRVLLASSS